MLAIGTRDKLVKVLALTASDHDGEALTAARMAHRLLTAAGLTWEDVIPPAADTRDLDLVAFCLDHPARLTAWERGFLQSIQRLLRDDSDLSAKQRAVLDRLALKCRADAR